MSDIPDLSQAFERDHPTPKRGRPASHFPSGKTMAEVADGMPCSPTLIGNWCLGLRVPDNRKLRFYELAGFADDSAWEAWKAERNRNKSKNKV